MIDNVLFIHETNIQSQKHIYMYEYIYIYCNDLY